MKIKKHRLKEIIQEEIQNYNMPSDESSSTDCLGCVFPEGEFQKEEVPIGSIVYMIVGKALDSIHEYRGDMSDDEEVSKDFEFLHKKLAEVWQMLDEHENLAAGQTPADLMRPVHESKESKNE